MDLFDYLSILTQFLLMILGAAVSLREDWTKRHHKVFFIAFLILGIAGMAAASKSAFDTAAAKEKLDQLGKSSQRLTELNTELQQQLVQLSKENIDTLVGGDSYCYLRFPTFDPRGGFPILVHIGKFPLYDVEVRIVDLQRNAQVVDKLGKTFTIQQYVIASSAMLWKVGNLAPNHSLTLLDKAVPMTDPEPDFRIFFSARNGFWEQDLLLRKIKGEWTHHCEFSGCFGRTRGAKTSCC